jgi:hypothetical protein
MFHSIAYSCCLIGAAFVCRSQELTMANPVPQFVPVLLPSVVFVFAPDEVVRQSQTYDKASHDVAFASIQIHDMLGGEVLDPKWRFRT